MKPLVKGDEIMDILRLKTGGPQVREWVRSLHPSSFPQQRSHRFLFSAAKPAAEVAARTSWGGERGCRVVDREDAREACKDLLTPICGEWSQVPEI